MRTVLLLVLILGLPATASAGVIRIADGDCGGFSAAVTAAASRATATTIVLARNGHYASCSLRLPNVFSTASALAIDAQGSNLQSTTLEVQAGSVTLTNATFDSPGTGAVQGLACDASRLGIDGAYFNYASWICNPGNLTLDTVTFHDMALPTAVSPGSTAIHSDSAVVIGNSGSLVLRT